MPRWRTSSSASPSPRSGTSRSTVSKHDSVTIPVGRPASTICRLARLVLTGSTLVARNLSRVLPLDVEELTPAFFSAALQLEIERAELLDQHSGTTGRARVGLRGEPGVPATVFV